METQSPHKKVGTTAPTFRPMSIVVKRSPIATAEHLFARLWTGLTSLLHICVHIMCVSVCMFHYVNGKCEWYFDLSCAMIFTLNPTYHHDNYCQ